MPTASLEGPTVDTDEKGGCPLSDTPSFSFRKEVQDYTRSCEYLLSSAGNGDNPPFTPDEQWIVAYYQAELGNLFAPVGQPK
jgi:hypothetical protein